MHPTQTSIRSDTNRFDARRVQLEEGARLIQLGESKQKTNFQRVESRLGLKLDQAETVGLHT